MKLSNLLAIIILQALTTLSSFAGEYIDRVMTTFYFFPVQSCQDKLQTSMHVIDKGRGYRHPMSYDFYHKLYIQGTGLVCNPSTGQYKVITIKKRYVYEVVYNPKAPYGYGKNNIPLIPFKSLAADTRRMPIGTRVYIKDFDGIVLSKTPERTIKHNGCWIVTDVGSRIKSRNGSGRGGSQLDLFIGKIENQKLLEQAGFNGKEKITIEVNSSKCAQL